MGMSEEDRTDLERRGVAVGGAVRGLDRLVERGLLDRSAVQLIARAWPHQWGPQTMAPRTDEERRRLEAWFLAGHLGEVEGAIADLESHVASGPYVAWLDRGLFARLRRSVAALDGVAEADLAWWEEPPAHEALVRTRDRARRALFDGVLLQRARGAAASAAVERRAAELVAALGDPDYAVRTAAQEGLLALGDAAIARLLASRDHPDPEVALRVGSILEGFFPPEPDR